MELLTNVAKQRIQLSVMLNLSLFKGSQWQIKNKTYSSYGMKLTLEAS